MGNSMETGFIRDVCSRRVLRGASEETETPVLDYVENYGTRRTPKSNKHYFLNVACSLVYAHKFQKNGANMVGTLNPKT